jgi:hypothetical protein
MRLPMAPLQSTMRADNCPDVQAGTVVAAVGGGALRATAETVMRPTARASTSNLFMPT